MELEHGMKMVKSLLFKEIFNTLFC